MTRRRLLTLGLGLAMAALDLLTVTPVPVVRAAAAQERIDVPDSPSGMAIEVSPVPIDLSRAGGEGGAASGGSALADGTTTRPAEVDRVVPATRTEIVDAREEHERTFAEPDGSMTLEVSAGRMHYRDPEGAWQPLDLRLVQGDAEGTLKVAASDRAVSFGTIDTDTLLARLSGDGHTIALRTVGFGTPILSDSTLRSAAPGGHEAVTVAPSDTGFEFRAILEDRAARNLFTFALDPGGLEVILDTDGSIRLLTSAELSGNLRTTWLVGRISAPVVFDAAGSVAPRDAVTVHLGTLASGETSISYALDPDWLARAVYPVTLDPTACIQVGGSGCDITGSTSAYLETYVGSGQTSYPTSPSWLRVGYDAIGSPDADWDYLRSMVFFPSTSLFTAQSAAMVTGATLRLRQDINRDGATNSFIARGMKKPWGPGSGWGDVNGKELPASYDSPAVSSCGTGSSDCNLDIDVSKIVRAYYTRFPDDWKANYGFQIRHASESSAYAETDFYLATNGTLSNRPKLTITYEVPKVAIDFDPALGANYAPASMTSGVATELPLIVSNTAVSTTYDECTSPADADCFQVGFRFIDTKGAVASSATIDLDADIAPGTSSATIEVPVTPPSVPGTYTLRLDLVRRLGGSTGAFLYASDWAQPKKYLSRDKKILDADSTRWTGSASVERDEFTVTVGSGATAVNQQSVGTSDGGSLAIDLATRNLHYEGRGGIGFGDLLPVGLTYGYDSASAAQDCPGSGYLGTLGACGWYTNWDERITDTSDAEHTGSYTYQGPSGTRYFLDTDGTGQIVGDVPVLVERPRVTIVDENGGPANSSVLASAEGISAVSGTRVLKVSPGSTIAASADLSDYISDFSLNVHRLLDAKLRTTSATGAGIAFKVENSTNPADDEQWIAYTLGTSFSTGADYQVNLGGTVNGTWGTIPGRNIHSDVAAGPFGVTGDQYQITGVAILDNGSGSTYVDATFFRPSEQRLIIDAEPTFTANGGAASTYTIDKASGTASVKVDPTTLAGAPRCDESDAGCWVGTGDLWSHPFTSWDWKKVGGDGIALVADFRDERAGSDGTPSGHATGTITYYAGPTPPAGAVNPLQVSDVSPVDWTRVTRNLLDDARQILGFYNDDPYGTNAAAPPSGPIGDRVSWTSYRLVVPDGSFGLFDDLRYASLPTRDPDYSQLTAADFRVTYADRSVHGFNRDGLLTRIRDLDGNTITLDYAYDATVANSQKSYTLTTIHAPTDGTTAGSWTYERQIDVSHTPSAVTFSETLGRVGAVITGRSTSFAVATSAGADYGVGDLIKINPARRDATCAGSGASGCVLLAYSDTTNHRLNRVADPRWDQSSLNGAGEYRLAVDWSTGKPTRIVDKSRNGSAGADLINVIYWDRNGTKLGSRVLWQDAAGRAAGYGRHLDLSPDGRTLIAHAPQACASGDCVNNEPSDVQATLDGIRTLANEFNGLARVSKTTRYRTPGADPVITRQGTRAGAKVDNYVNPLLGGQLAWSQSADQLVASRADSANTSDDLYRTTYTYDDLGRITHTVSPALDATPDFHEAILTATTAGTSSGNTDMWGLYHLDETSGSALDADGSAQNGTNTSVTQNVTSSALVNAGWANKAYTYNGTSSVTTLASFGTATGSFSISALVKPAVYSTTIALAGSRGASDYTFDLKLMVDTAGRRIVRADVGNGTTWLLQHFDAPFDWQNGDWAHIGLAVDDATDTASLFAEGRLIGAAPFTTAGTPLMADAARTVKIGTNGKTSGQEWFNGSIDEVGIWKVALNRAQFQNLFLAARSMALRDVETIYDAEGHIVQRGDQFLANPGFESGKNHGWRSSANVTAITAGGANVHSGFGSIATGTDGAIAQEIMLVPGQTFRVQGWTKVASSGVANYRVEYWSPATDAWVTFGGMPATYTETAWTAHAFELTLPLASDGRVRVRLSNSAGVGTVYIDDVALFTSLRSATYLASGLPSGSAAPAPDGTGLVTTTLGYAATATTPAVFPTTTIANDVGSVTDPTTQDVTSTTVYDAWGRPTSTTDPDGVTVSNAFVTSGNGVQTDLAWTEDELGNRTSFTYDTVGNRLTTTTPRGVVTATTYDLSNHAVDLTSPDGTLVRHAYDAYGQRTSTTANYLDGSVSGPTGVDDIRTTAAFDEFGRVTTNVLDQGGIGRTTTATYDQLDNVITSTTHGRTVDNRFGLTYGLSRPTPTGVRLPVAPTASPAPLCPDSGSVRCNTILTLDLAGRTIATTDAYGIGSVTRYDLDGRPVGSIAAHVDGVRGASEPDTDVITLSTFGLTGLPRAVTAVTGTYPATPVTGDTATTTYDALGRPTLVTRPDGAFTKTRYTAAGRVERTSRVAASGTGDASLVWTRTIYDAAGRAITTVDHYDGTYARAFVDGFERDFANWSVASTGWYTASAASGPYPGETNSSVAPMSGERRLHVNTASGSGYSGAWRDYSGRTFVSGRAYKLRFDFLGTSGTTYMAFLGVDQSGGSGVTVDGDPGTAGTQPITGDGTWRSYSATWTPSSTVSSNVHFAVRKDTAGTAGIYLDNVTLYDSTATDYDITTDTILDADGNVIRSVLPPGDLAVDRPLTTATGYDAAGSVVSVTVNALANQHGVIGHQTYSGGVGYWPLDDVATGGQATDLNAANHPLTPSASGVAKGVAGGRDASNTAYRFDGTGNLTTSGVTLPTAAWTIEAWFRTDTAGQVSKGIAGDWVSGSGGMVYLSSGGQFAAFGHSTSVWSGIVPVTGRWYHVAGTYNGSTLAVYVDGVLKGSTAMTGAAGAGATAFEVGSYSNGSGATKVKGDIDEVAVYSQAHSSALATHFAQQRPTDAATSLTTRTVYDVIGRPTDTYDPRLVRTHYDLDRLGQPTKTVAAYVDGTPTDGTTVDDDVTSTFAYAVTGELVGYCPAAQNVIGGCDPSSGGETQAWRYAHDAMGRLVSQTPPVNTTLTALDTTRWEYQTGGRLANTCQTTAAASSCTTSGAHRRSAFTYDALGREVTATINSGASAGTQRGSWTTTYAGDGSGRVTSIAFAGSAMFNETTGTALDEGSDTLAYTYVASGAGRGQLDQIKRGATVYTDYAYNADGTIASRVDTNPVSTGTTYSTTFGYDWAQRNTTVAASSLFSATAATFAYRADGLIGKRTLPNGETFSFGYDPAKRPTAISLASGDGLTRAYDRAGRVTGDGRTFAGIAGDAGGNAVSYAYDELDRLVSETGLADGVTYRYDHDGNRIRRESVGLTTVTTDYTYDRTDQLASLTQGSTLAFTYDTSGNLTSEPLTGITSRSLEYDSADRLVKVTPTAGSPATFAFDALGRFKSRTVGATTDTYGYVGQSETTFALAGGASTRLSAFDLGGSRISVKDGSTVGYLVPDLHGSVVATEGSGSSAIASALRYDGYGRTAAVALPGGTVALDTRYTGALDLSPDSTPLYDIGARLYSPASGAWTQLDTYGGQAQDPASMNRFLYAHANPTTFIDPTGHFIQKADKDPYPTPEAKQRIQKNIETYGNANGSKGGGNTGGGAEPPMGPISTVPGVSDERFTHIGDIRLGWWGGPTSMADLDQLGAWCLTLYQEASCEAYQIGLTTMPADPEFIHSLLDVFGVVDPTPLSDGLNAGLYADEGDTVNAGVSGVSSAGWFFTDLVKLPRLAGKLLDALRSIGKRADNAPLGPPSELAERGARAADLAANARSLLGSPDDIVVLGRRSDTAIASAWEGHVVLNAPQWSLELNDEFIRAAVEQRRTIYLASPTKGNLVQTSGRFAGQPTIFARELNMLRQAGYRPSGLYLVPPS